MTDVYGPLYGASAIAANGIIRYTLGAIFPLFTVQSKFVPFPTVKLTLSPECLWLGIG
jgi:hypothetical protein